MFLEHEQLSTPIIQNGVTGVFVVVLTMGSAVVSLSLPPNLWRYEYDPL